MAISPPRAENRMCSRDTYFNLSNTSGNEDAPSRLIFVQPAIPHYRLDFYQRLAAALSAHFAVYYSPSELNHPFDDDPPVWMHQIGPTRPISPGLWWQSGVMSIPLRRRDVLVLSGNLRWLSTLALLAKARLRGVRTIWWSHLWSATSRRLGLVLRLVLMRCAHEVLFYTDREVGEYRSMLLGRLDRRAIHALSNGININPVVALRQPYRASDRKPAILFVGRLTRKADLDLLLHALRNPALAESRLEVVGDGPEASDLRKLAVRLGIANRVVWHGAITDEAKLAPIANECRLFCYPGAVGLSLVHAMAYGLPTVLHGNRWHHMPEIAAFSAGETGLSFHEGSTESLAKAIGQLINDPAALDRMSANAIATVKVAYNTASMANVMIGIYRQHNQ